MGKLSKKKLPISSKTEKQTKIFSFFQSSPCDKVPFSSVGAKIKEKSSEENKSNFLKHFEKDLNSSEIELNNGCSITPECFDISISSEIIEQAGKTCDVTLGSNAPDTTMIIVPNTPSPTSCDNITDSDSSVIFQTPEEKINANNSRMNRNRSFLHGLGQYSMIGKPSVKKNVVTRHKFKKKKTTLYDGINYKICDDNKDFKNSHVETTALLSSVLPMPVVANDIKFSKKKLCDDSDKGSKLIIFPSPSPNALTNRKHPIKRSASKGLSPNPKRLLTSPAKNIFAHRMKRKLKMDICQESDTDVILSTPVKPPHRSAIQSEKNISLLHSRKQKAVKENKDKVTLAGDDLLAGLLSEMKDNSSKSLKNAPTKRKYDEKVNCHNSNFEEAFNIDENNDRNAVEKEVDVLSDIIDEIRGCTQATKQHHYDKSLQNYQSKLCRKQENAKNHVQHDLTNNVLTSRTDVTVLQTDTSSSKNCSSKIIKEDIVDLGLEESFSQTVVLESQDVSQKELKKTMDECSFEKLHFDSDKNESGGCMLDADENLPQFGKDESWMGNVDLDGPDELLSKELSKLSPFKPPVNSHLKIDNILPPSSKYGRHKVMEVIKNSTNITLHVAEVPPTPEEKTCILEGFWMDSMVKPGDIVNVLAEFDDENRCCITDNYGLLIVNPDVLISGTTVVSTVYCMRKSVLNNTFKGSEGGNIHMLKGSIIHSLFQKVIQDKIFTLEEITSTAHEILKEKPFLHDMYSLGINETHIFEEIQKFIPQIKLWMDKYSFSKRHVFGNNRCQTNDIQVLAVKDIEENVWSPRFGIKGKVDVTVEVKLKKNSSEKKIIPLELKTGKSSFSVEHKGQVTLYSMMMSDRRLDPESGLLLYLQDCSMKVIPALPQNKRGLIQLRNELSQHLANTMTHVDGKFKLQKLPGPINNERGCAKCPQLLNCTAYQRSFEEHCLPPGHAMEALIPTTLSHLTDSYLQYYVHWCLLFQMESNTNKNDTRNIWCMTGPERESRGKCLSGVMLEDKTYILENGRFVQTFTRHVDNVEESLDCILNLHDSVVVSCESKCEIALTMGFVHSLTDKKISLAVDRDLHLSSDWKSMIFRIDKCDFYNSMGSNFTNVSKIMENTPVSAKLRELIIDLRVPEFCHVLPKNDISKVKHIFRLLNKPQKTAVLKVLMCEDYVLIKGYPGTGKTSTIVALVRILSELGLTVLLTSYTHSAVDNILLKLKQYKLNFLRLGRLERIKPDIQPYAAEHVTRKFTSVAELESFYASQAIVATTCLGVNHPIFSQRIFDVCIVDEASQILQPACIGPLLYAKKFALVGDPEQLPPVVQSKEAVALGMDESLFKRLDTSHATYELDVQYRMNKSIMSLSNEIVYNGALKCHSLQLENQCLHVPNQEFLNQITCKWLSQCLSPESGREVIFLDTSQVPALESRSINGMIQNEREAVLCMHTVHALIKCGIPQCDVGVIAPYRNQVNVLRRKIEDFCGEGIEVNTVDQYQGRDKDVIIMSFTRSQLNTDKQGDILHDLRRLNVAVTRAKVKLIFFGSKEALLQYEPINSLLQILKTEQIVSLPFEADKMYCM